MKSQDEGWQKAKAVLHKGGWNSYEILADGPHIRLTFNGVVTINARSAKSSAGDRPADARGGTDAGGIPQPEDQNAPFGPRFRIWWRAPVIPSRLQRAGIILV